MKGSGLRMIITGIVLCGCLYGARADTRLDNAFRIQKEIDQFETNPSLIKEAFELVEEFESEVGPLFLTQKTRNGFSRKPNEKLALEQALFAIQQGLMDHAYTAENLKKYRTLFEGAQFKTAAYFPGPVDPPKDPKQIHSVEVNGSQPPAFGSPVAGRENSARRPTGCYLAPGCVAEIAVPAALVNQGYSIRVGAHSWDLVKKKTIKRLDRVSLVFPITETRTLIAHPLGGGIYIEVPYEADAGVVTIQLRNVVRSPFFSARSFDKMTSNDWKKERMLDAPWADFESDKFMMQVPSAWIRDLDDPETLMADWDKAMDAISELFGHPLNRSKQVLYMQVDVIMRGSANFPGYPQSNNPYQAHHPEQCRHKWMIEGPQNGTATAFHEVGHSEFISKFRGEVEALVNLPYVAVQNRMFGISLDQAFGGSRPGFKHLTLDEVAVMWMVTENFRKGKEMNYTNRPGDEMKYQHRGYGKYVEIANLFGWDALSRFWRMDHENYEDGDKVPQNRDPVDDRILRLSMAAGADLRPLIHFWGIQPEHPKALENAINKAGLNPSPDIFQRLEEYKTVIPRNNEEFRAHSKRVYPRGIKNIKSPRYGPGWYQAQLTEYSEADGKAAHAALQEIMELYFSKE
ncbi:MAG: M60 family metallopeptidase [Pontiella sp.]